MDGGLPDRPRCLVCTGGTEALFAKRVLGRHEVTYHRCTTCGFTQTDRPHWLEEAYRAPTSPLDIGAATRPVSLARLTSELLRYHFDARGRFLDYGGGVGLFVRLMRDRGFRFFRYDKYCGNVFAQYFDLDDVPLAERRFELVTCFEVLEHSTEPAAELARIFELGDSLLAATSLVPDATREALERWPYLGAEHGQHVSFFTRRSLELLAERHGRFLYTNETDLHLFSKARLRGFDFHNLQRKTLPYRVGTALLRRAQAVLDRALAPRPSSTPGACEDDALVMRRFLQEQRGQRDR